MTSDHPLTLLTDDTPRVTVLTPHQSSLAVSERDVTLLVAAAAAVLNGTVRVSLSDDERRRLRRLNAMLFRQLSDACQQDVRARSVTAESVSLRQSA